MFRVALVSLIFCGCAGADMGLILLEPTGHGMSRFTGAGHAEIYLSRICPASPVSLRLCEAGEHGSIISNYTSFGENHSYEWNAVPFELRIYGVERAEDRPLFGSAELRRFLQDQYRARYLMNVCGSEQCENGPNAHWRDLIGGDFERTIYLFEVKTTLAQDEQLIERLNSSVNVNRYNGFTRNCADFSRKLINSYFPKAARRDRVNDFGMTTPKAIAKSFVHYASQHPELELRVRRFPQIPSHTRRSTDFRKGTELSFRSKKWLVPMLLRSHELALFAISYGLTGRFNPQRELARHPDASDPATASSGTSEQWKRYRDLFIRYSAAARGANGALKEFEADGRPRVGQDGTLSMEVESQGRPERIGVSADNVLDGETDPVLTYRLLLARTALIMREPRKRREAPAAFEDDWNLLQEAHRAAIEKPAGQAP